MGSPVNSQFTKLRSYDINERTITGTYTVRTGRQADLFVIDNPVLITDPAADFTLTVPDGIQVGQELIVLLTSNSSSKTATITTTTGDDNTLDTAGDFAVYQWMGSTSGWQYIHGEVAS